MLDLTKLIKLEFIRGSRFNQSIDRTINTPSENIKYESILPNSLEELTFTSRFNLPIMKLPSNLKTLILPSNYNINPELLEILKAMSDLKMYK